MLINYLRAPPPGGKRGGGGNRRERLMPTHSNEFLLTSLDNRFNYIKANRIHPGGGLS
jgi:hypothetical protein